MDTPKEIKNRSTIEKILAIAVPVGTMIVMITATIMIFFAKPSTPCGIDKEGIWCHTHPFTLWDVVGLILFYIGGLWLSSLLPNFIVKRGWLEDDDDKFPALNFIAAVLLVGGMGLIYMN